MKPSNHRNDPEAMARLILEAIKRDNLNKAIKAESLQKPFAELGRFKLCLS